MNWFVKEESSSYFQRTWCETKPIPDLLKGDKVIKRVRCWDLASTEPSEQNPDPDYTAGVLMAYTKSGQYIVEDIVHGRWTAGILEEVLAEQMKKDAAMYGGGCMNYLPQDPAASGKVAKRHYSKTLNQMGVTNLRFFKVGTKKSKLDRFLPFSSASATGLVSFVEAAWNDVAFNELELFTGTRSRIHDDIVDAMSDAYNQLATSKPLPVVSPEYLNF